MTNRIVCLAAFLLCAADPAPEPMLFVQASRVNLRARASATAEVVGQLVIGTACTVLERSASGWVRIQASGSNGWAKEDLLGPAPPDYEALLAKARDRSLPPGDRLNFALRAVALRPDQPKAQELTAAAFVDVELSTLPAEPPKQRTEDALEARFSCDPAQVAACAIDAVKGMFAGRQVRALNAPAPVLVVVAANEAHCELAIAVVGAPENRGRSVDKKGEGLFAAKLLRIYDVPMDSDIYTGIFGRSVADSPACRERKATKQSDAATKVALRSTPRSWVGLDTEARRRQGGSDEVFVRTRFCGVDTATLEIEQSDATWRDQSWHLKWGSPVTPTVLPIRTLRAESAMLTFELEAGGTCTLSRPFPKQPEVAQLVCTDVVLPSGPASWKAFYAPANSCGRFPIEESCEDEHDHQ